MFQANPVKTITIQRPHLLVSGGKTDKRQHSN